MIFAAEIANFLNKKLHGKNIEIHKPVSLNLISTNSVTFAKKKTKQVLEKINANPKVLVIAHNSFEGTIETPHILSDNPRLDFALIMKEFFVAKTKSHIATTVQIGQNVILGENVSIGEYTVIDDNVSIGNNTIIGSHVRIKENVILGNDCLIKSHAVIGEPGFGFERNARGVPIRIPHIGGVKIDNNVEIGTFSTIAAGTLEPTLIKENTKIDDHVHISHNCIIEENCIITACVEISGSVTVGKTSWIGPNTSIIEKVNIGEDTFIGIGSVVNKSVDDFELIAGNPARSLYKGSINSEAKKTLLRLIDNFKK